MLIHLGVEPIETTRVSGYYDEYENGDEMFRSRKHLLINRRQIHRKRGPRIGRFELRLRVNQRRSSGSAPTDDVAKKIDELWPEIETGIEYLRTR